MNHFEQTRILKPSKSLGNGGCGQFRKHPGEILVRHPNPITAGMKVLLSLPLLPVKVVKLNVDGHRTETQPLNQFVYGRKILHNQSSSMNELKTLRL